MNPVFRTEFYEARKKKICPPSEAKQSKAMVHEKVRALLDRPRIKQHTGDWYKQRSIRLTASDVPAVLGHNPYCTREEVFLRKTNQRAPFKGNAACFHGQKYEPLACKAYTETTGIKLVEEDIGLVTHSGFNEFGASPDRVAVEHPILIEVKCPFRRKVVPGEIPRHYIDQVEFQLACTGLDLVHFVQFVPGGIARRGVLDITQKYRDPEWWDRNLNTLHDFWRDVVQYWEQNPGKQPPRKLVVDPLDNTVCDTGAKDRAKDKDDQAHADTFSLTTTAEFNKDFYDISMQAYKAD